MHKQLALAAALLLAVFSAHAGNENSNPCGNNGNNCNQGGGDATATGGNAYSGAAAGAVAGAAALSGSSSSVGDVKAYGGAGGSSVSVSEGGKGGAGGSAFSAGGDAKQQQTNVGINGQSLDSKVANTVGAVGTGNTTSVGRGGDTAVTVGGDTTLVERNVAPIYMGPLTPTNCGGSVGAGGGDRSGNALISWTWTGQECKIRMLGDRFQALGQVDVACELYRSTKAFAKAAKRNPNLRSVSCAAKPTPAAAPLVPQAFLEARTPRG